MEKKIEGTIDRLGSVDATPLMANPMEKETGISNYNWANMRVEGLGVGVLEVSDLRVQTAVG